MPWRTTLLVVGLLAVATLAVNRNTFTAPFVFDDAASITENATLHSLWPLWTAFSPPAGGAPVAGRPLVNFSFAVNYAISGEEVWSYHALNLVIHFLAACTLFGVVRRTLGQPRLRSRFGAAQLHLAAAVAGLWLLHPLQTKAVTYVSQRAESLCGLLCLLTLYCFLRATEESDKPRNGAWLTLSWVACLLGMATKEVMAAAPLLVLSYDLILLRDGAVHSVTKTLRQSRVYYTALAATWILLAFLVFGTRARGGTVGLQAGLSSFLYLQTQCHAIATYLKLSVWPHPLVFDYGMSVVRAFSEVWLQALMLCVLLLGTVIALWRRSALGFLGLWFFAILAPSSSFVPIASETIAEHRMYLPLAAVITLIVTGAYALLGRRSLLLWPVLACALGWLSFERNEAYRSELTLWRDTVDKVPNNSRARYNLSIAYSNLKQFSQAVEQDEAALKSDDGWAAEKEAPAIQNKLGYDLAALGRVQDAVTHYEQAMRLRPHYATAQLNLARALVRLNRTPEALLHFQEAFRLETVDAKTEAEFADALMQEGGTEEAIPHYSAALRLAPTWAAAHHALACACIMTGRLDAAITSFREALRLNPHNVSSWGGLGDALLKAGRLEEAIAAISEAVKLQPRLPEARHILGIALSRAGRITEAITQFREELRLTPNSARAHRALAEELQRAGYEAEAAEHRKAASQLETP